MNAEKAVHFRHLRFQFLLVPLGQTSGHIEGSRRAVGRSEFRPFQNGRYGFFFGVMDERARENDHRVQAGDGFVWLNKG